MISKFKALCVVLIALVILSVPCGAVPVLDAWSNDVTNDESLYPHTEYAGYINFSANSTETIVTWTWLLDGVDQSNNAAFFNHSFTDAGHVNVTVYGTNANGVSNQIGWKPYVKRQLETTQFTTGDKVDETAWNQMIDSFSGEGSMSDFLGATVLPYTNIIGAMFYLIIFGLSLAMQWIRQSNILMPVVVILTLSSILFGLLPDDWKLYAALAALMGSTSTLWIMYKDR